ncbi:MAG: SpoIIE family protein phosphatase [Flavobacteriales bacterium]|nr:SpoIIE family protein phosphatase [Flavobacteriales bacterium]
MIKQVIKSIALLLFIPSLGFGQTISFTHFDTEDGLPQAQVQTIQQDGEGNLWLGTMSGLSKYNGRGFQNYTRGDSLAEDWITTSMLDSRGDIWFGHWGGGVSKYLAGRKAFVNLDFDIISQFNPITIIFEDSKGNYWFGTDGGGVYRYDVENNTIFVVTEEESLNGNNVMGICEDPDGNIWMGTNNGITVYRNDMAINDASAFSYLNIEKGLFNNAITTLKRVHEDEIWIGTEDAGIVIIKVKAGQAINEIENIRDALSVNITAEEGLASNQISVIYEDRDGLIWIGTRDAGITRYRPKEGNRDNELDLAAGSFKSFGMDQGLSYNKVNSIFQDREGNCWIGTEVGIDQYVGEKFLVYDDDLGIPSNVVWSVFEDSQAHIWLGTNDGLSKFSWEAGKLIVDNFGLTLGAITDIVVSIAEDDLGNMWLATASNGVVKMGASGSYTSYTTDNGLANNVVYSVAKDQNGDMWFGTATGANKFVVAEERFETFTVSGGLSGNHIYRIYADSKGKIWFGVLGATISVYDGSKFSSFEDVEEIAGKFALAITEDTEGNIWIGAYGSGIYKYDGTAFTGFTKADGLSSESPSLLISDAKNNIWIGSSTGLDKYNQETNRFTHYGKKEGFVGIETNANACSMGKDGRLWFGTIMGAISYSPLLDLHNSLPPITAITDLKIKMHDAELVNNSEYNYDENHFTFGFIGVSLTNPDGVRYSYQLEGFEDEWSPVTSAVVATYSNLPHGEFKFLVKASNEENVWSEATAYYTFTIIPPFWKTLWFYGLVAVFSILAFFLIDKLRTAKLKKEKKVLEAKVEERTVELAHKNEELNEKNEDITAGIRYAKRIQTAILPPIEVLHEHYPESFVFFRPKDIVSGDFYWMEKNNGNLLFTAVDCTGHGVPGAFMSIIGNNILSDVVDKQGIVKPSEILRSLSKGVYETLRQATEDGDEYDEVKDAMDLAFCSIEVKTNKLQFAGAYNPLFLVRNGEILETGADRLAIGANPDVENLQYTNNEVDLQSGDTLYIFSDGFVDQFGGKKGKKFMNRRFKQMLLDIQEMKMADQEKHLDERLVRWRGEHDQVDDILVIGVRIP